MNTTEPLTASPWTPIGDDLRAVLAFITMVTSVYGLWAFVSARRFYRVWAASRDLSSNKLKLKLKGYQLQRDNFVQSLTQALKFDEFTTLLVYGQRGIGKSTAIYQALRGRAGVWQWTVSKEDESAFVKLESSLDEMFAPWKRDNRPEQFKIDVLSSIVEKRGPIIIVVSLDASTTADHVLNILRFCKQWGEDKKLIQFVVDISSCFAALDIRTDIDALRAAPLAIGRLTVPEATILVERNLPDGWTKERKIDVTELIIRTFDLTPLTLKRIWTRMHGGMTKDDVTGIIRKSKAIQVKKVQEILQRFDEDVMEEIHKLSMETFQKLGMKEKRIPPLVKEEPKPKSLDQEGYKKLKTLLGTSTLVDIVARAGSPHIFEIDPFTFEAALNGKIVKEEFIRYYEKKND